ncbi:MAG: hypothetical protein NTZ10_04660 [Candidatus Saganbacteria bacterium]|nr:hypothetical protein [Candidatus Saganbacteria bacterium]
MKIKTAVLLVFLFCCPVLALDNIYSSGTSSETISLSLKDAPITTVLYSLGKEAGMNVVVSNTVKGKVTLSLKDVPPFEALLSVIRSCGYSYKIENGILRVTAPNAQPGEKPSYEVDIFRDKGLLTKSFTINQVTADDAKDMLMKLDYPNTRIFSTKGSNIVVVEAPAASMQKISGIVKQLNIAPNQVLVESQLMEITLGNGATPSKLGVKGKYSGSTYTAQTEGFANPATTGTPGFYAHVVKGNLDAYLEALEHKEGYNLLANPKIVAVSGRSANIISGSKLGYKTTLTTTTGTSQIIDFLEVGTKLTFTAYISSDGTIKMDIHPEVSEGSISTDGLPQKQTTEATTTVIVRDGETIIIGGLIKNKSKEVENGIPFLMSIPIIGNAFKSKEILWEKKEIIAMLTPHLITPARIKTMGVEIDTARQKQKDANTGEAPNLWWWMK